MKNENDRGIEVLQWLVNYAEKEIKMAQNGAPGYVRRPVLSHFYLRYEIFERRQ